MQGHLKSFALSISSLALTSESLPQCYSQLFELKSEVTNTTAGNSQIEVSWILTALNQNHLICDWNGYEIYWNLIEDQS